jgi:hypothetical protein
MHDAQDHMSLRKLYEVHLMLSQPVPPNTNPVPVRGSNQLPASDRDPGQIICGCGWLYTPSLLADVDVPTNLKCPDAYHHKSDR